MCITLIVCVWDLAEWLARLAVNPKVATVLVSIPASSDTYKSDEAVLNNVHKNIKLKKSPFLSFKNN
jgi:hypothetical protein